MYKILTITLILITSIVNLSFTQDLQEKYIIKLNDSGKSNNDKVPLIFSTLEKTLDTLYLIDGKYATKESMKFKKSTKISSIVDFMSVQEYLNIFSDKKMFVDVTIKDAQLILSPRASELVEKLGSKNQISIDITKGVILRKESTKFSALTIPFKAYLGGSSDSIVSFTNNIETNVNVALTFGMSFENHSFNVNQESKLRSHHYVFGLIGANKLKLNKKNTDNSELVSDDVILTISAGMGYQFGFDKIGISVILGIDTPTSSLGDEWVFKNSLWLGVGLGYGIFK